MSPVYAELLRVQGKSNAEIARMMFVTERKVRDWLDAQSAEIPQDAASDDEHPQVDAAA